MHSTSILKDLLRRFIPGPLLFARQARRNRLRREYGAELWKATGGRVAAGPFAGMHYVENASGSTLGPKLLGCYESELHDAIAQILTAAHDVVVNVGAGEGYYAVGLITRLLQARGVAFETDETGQRLMRDLAELNGVGERLDIRGCCQIADLAACLCGAASPLIVMDVEGAEDHLLNPVLCPDLRRAAILVEVHEYLCPGVTSHLLSWYEPTHTIRRIPTAAGSANLIPKIPGLTAGQLALLADEMRSLRMEWMFARPRVS